MKIISFAQRWTRGICILAAAGGISNVTLGQPSTSGGTLTYEGWFDILSLSGAFMSNEIENGGVKGWSGGMSVSLAGPDGRVLGRGLAGMLVAAGPVQDIFNPSPPSQAMDFLQEKEAQIGLAVALVAVVATAAYFYSSKKTRGCLNPESFKQFKLVKRTQLSHNVAKFRFELPTPTSVLGLPIGQHISCRGKDSQGEEVIKPYTPTTLDSDVGYFELVIKMYPQGRMSHYFRELQEGDYMAVKGPKGCFKYEPNQVRAFGMLAGGSGITPMFQVARVILENPKDKTQVHLIYANVTYDDILLKEELEGLTTNYPGRFHVYYVLNQPPEEWNGGVGFVSKEMIQAHCPEPAFDIKILRCGPPPMNKAMAGADSSSYEGKDHGGHCCLLSLQGWFGGMEQNYG